MYNYRLPNKKKWLLTDAFLITFKEELNRIFKIKEEDNPTYWNTYRHLDSTGGYYKALKIASKIHNVKKAIYEYACKMPWYLGDQFDAELTIMMYKKHIINEGSLDEIPPDYTDEDLAEWEKSGEIRWVEEVQYFNGYYVTRRDWEFVE